MTSESKYSELKAAAMAATDGPWESIYDDWSDGDDALISCESRDGMVAIAKIEGGGSESSFDGSFRTEQQANTRYIVATNPAVVLALLAELETSKKSNAFLKEQLAKLANFNPDWDMLEACRESWRDVAAALKEAEARLEAKDKRIAELEASETQLIQERDSAEQALADMYEAATGERPEWSNWFVFSDAIEEVAQVRAKLATPVRLPDIRSDDYHETGWFQHMKYYRDVERSLRAAGFKVEGDEQ